MPLVRFEVRNEVGLGTPTSTALELPLPPSPRGRRSPRHCSRVSPSRASSGSSASSEISRSLHRPVLTRAEQDASISDHDLDKG